MQHSKKVIHTAGVSEQILTNSLDYSDEHQGPWYTMPQKLTTELTTERDDYLFTRDVKI